MQMPVLVDLAEILNSAHCLVECDTDVATSGRWQQRRFSRKSSAAPLRWMMTRDVNKAAAIAANRIVRTPLSVSASARIALR